MYKNKIIFLCTFLLLTGCFYYHSPDRSTWGNYLNGASFTDMNEISRIAKRPVYLGAGGQLVTNNTKTKNMEYGDKIANDNSVSINYMSDLEYELYDSLRKPGLSVQRAGTEVVIILIRDAIMKQDVADISETGADTLKIISKVLNKYDATFIEIAGYTDAMGNQQAAKALSLDMAQRVGVYLSQHGINPTRMFIVGRGATRPIAAQDSIGRLTNRRVEIKLAPAR